MVHNMSAKDEILKSSGAFDMIELFITAERGTVNSLDVKRFNKNISIQDLKWRLEIITGRSSGNMKVTLLDGDHCDICKLDNNNQKLSDFPVSNGNILLVEDPAYVELEENPAVKFKLTDEQYDTRRGTLKEFLIKNKIGKYNPDNVNQKYTEFELEEEKKKKLAEQDSQVFESIKVGDRCEVSVPEQPIRRGVVMYKGEIKNQPGLWVGIKYDEPFGKHDGSINGVKYFEAPMKYGGFVRPSYIKTGDYPEICELDFDSDHEF